MLCSFMRLRSQHPLAWSSYVLWILDTPFPYLVFLLFIILFCFPLYYLVHQLCSIFLLFCLVMCQPLYHHVISILFHSLTLIILFHHSYFSSYSGLLDIIFDLWWSKSSLEHAWKLAPPLNLNHSLTRSHITSTPELSRVNSSQVKLS